MKVVKTPQFDLDQIHIEDHIFESNDKQVQFVEKFVTELVDKGKGVFIAAQDGKTTLVSWSEPALTKLRIELFYEKCAKLQPPRKMGN